jgi:FlaA1/EpsC-like NDP-sugar epimerase
VLDMGEPVRIADVACQLAEQAPTPVEIVYTGLRPGEKLHEELFADGEQDLRPLHPLISHVTVPPLHPDRVLLIDPGADEADLIAKLADLCRTETTLQPAAAQPAAAQPAAATHQGTGKTRGTGEPRTKAPARDKASARDKVVGRQFTKS